MVFEKFRLVIPAECDSCLYDFVSEKRVLRTRATAALYLLPGLRHRSIKWTFVSR